MTRARSRGSPAGTLAHRFGPDGVAAARLARGEDDTPSRHTRRRRCRWRRSSSTRPPRRRPLLFALKRLADRVAAPRGATPRRPAPGRPEARSARRGAVVVTLAQPTASAARWLAPAKEHLFSLRLRSGDGDRARRDRGGPLAAEQLAIDDRPETLAALETVLAARGALGGERSSQPSRSSGAGPRRRIGRLRSSRRGRAPASRPRRTMPAGDLERPASRRARSSRPARPANGPAPIVAGEGGRRALRAPHRGACAR